ncbi:hypothetical protein BCD67_25695 [Oscillatoriales cyanobacterium USR001]|nr:hypothetical protein BCD67_25695 [Oscillatoriales cyanobacterium USR001]
MYKEEQIKQLFGDEALDYLKNKNQGGTNNQKGSDYETNFTVYQLALLSKRVIEENELIKFYTQVPAFVDDLLIEFADSNIFYHYQLKSGTSVTWGKGIKSIADDFKKQQELNLANSKTSNLYLVVSVQDLCAALNQNIPNEIKLYSQVIYFPRDPKLVKIIEQEPAFREAIEYLSAFENPAPDKIECVVTVLLGAWVCSDKSGISLMDILKKAQKSTPSYICSFSQERQLDPQVENILSNIDNFSYNLTKGFLHWSYRDGLEEGTLPYSIDTDRFRQFQQLIEKNNPTSFEQLEVFLI